MRRAWRRRSRRAAVSVRPRSPARLPCTSAARCRGRHGCARRTPMPSTRSTLAASVAAGLIATVATPAALAAPGPAPQATDLDQVVVTATRTATTVEQALAPVEVLGRDAIERSQARSLHDLLRGRAGISLSRQGGPGKLATLFMRGAESDQTVVLVDGIKMGPPPPARAPGRNLPAGRTARSDSFP